MDVYYKQGVPFKPSANSTSREELIGIGVLVHDANDDLEANPDQY